MKKLSTDYFESIKAMKGPEIQQPTFDKDKDLMMAQISQLKEDTEVRLQEHWASMRSQMMTDMNSIKSAQSGMNELLNKMRLKFETTIIQSPSP